MRSKNNTGTKSIQIVKTTTVEQLFVVVAKAANTEKGALSVIITGGQSDAVYEDALLDALNPVRDNMTITLPDKKDWQHVIVISNLGFELNLI